MLGLANMSGTWDLGPHANGSYGIIDLYTSVLAKKKKTNKNYFFLLWIHLEGQLLHFSFQHFFQNKTKQFNCKVESSRIHGPISIRLDDITLRISFQEILSTTSMFKFSKYFGDFFI